MKADSSVPNDVSPLLVGLGPEWSLVETERSIHVGDQHGTSPWLAEHTRLLHDTAINTLLAIANGVAGTVSIDAVRQQCARDVAILGSLTEFSVDGPDARVSLHDVFGPANLAIHRTGLDDEHLQRVAERLSPAGAKALLACAREAITNAAKHSGCNEIEVSYGQEDGQLSLTVKDDGGRVRPRDRHRLRAIELHLRPSC